MYLNFNIYFYRNNTTFIVTLIFVLRLILVLISNVILLKCVCVCMCVVIFFRLFEVGKNKRKASQNVYIDYINHKNQPTHAHSSVFKMSQQQSLLLTNINKFRTSKITQPSICVQTGNGTYTATSHVDPDDCLCPET